MKKNVLALMAVVAGFAATAQTYKPAIKLEAGKKYTVNTVTKATITQEAMGQSIEIPVDFSAYQLLEIKGVVPEGYQSDNTTHRIVVAMNAMGQDMKYDSDKKEDRDSEMGKSLNDNIGKTSSFVVSNNGRIIEKEKTTTSAELPKEDASAGGGDMMTNMLKNMGLGNNSSSPAFNLFPNVQEIKIGASFIDTEGSDKDGKTKNTTTYTLVAIKDGIAEFSLNGTGSIDREMEAQGMQIKITTTNKSTGSMLVDVATGLLSKKTVVTETTGNMEVSGMQMPMGGKSTTTIEVAPAK